MPSIAMTLKILLPFGLFLEKAGVTRLVVETIAGSYGFLPRRRDCAAVLVPGILAYDSEPDGETFLGVDEGVLVKTGGDVVISVRRAIAGPDLARLREAVERDFAALDAQELRVRSLSTKLELEFLNRYSGLHHG